MSLRETFKDNLIEAYSYLTLTDCKTDHRLTIISHFQIAHSAYTIASNTASEAQEGDVDQMADKLEAFIVLVSKTRPDLAQYLRDYIFEPFRNPYYQSLLEELAHK